MPLRNGGFAMEKKTVTETQIGNTLFIVTAECSPTAKETIEKKLERLICRHFSDANSCQPERDKHLAIITGRSD